ncbi:AGC protein kinase [Phytophthora cinnamomi]|uniref:AGC protein kinase n=1 Tax=Phytophthora cinnamomi TaxID=4785 RepID=UPI0035599F3D|nr:AGC protein kinase [Phytophthora cinnamomi]
MSGSGSSSLEYGCDCRSIRRVSLMGASDYCLDPNASLSSKCGNVDLGESGACPITGAQPCSPKGHVLANDSLCALDDKDETYKCVASKKDLDIQKKGKRKKNKPYRRGHGSGSSVSNESSRLMLTARQVVAVVVGVAVGVMVVV